MKGKSKPSKSEKSKRFPERDWKAPHQIIIAFGYGKGKREVAVSCVCRMPHRDPGRGAPSRDPIAFVPLGDAAGMLHVYHQHVREARAKERADG